MRLVLIFWNDALNTSSHITAVTATIPSNDMGVIQMGQLISALRGLRWFNLLMFVSPTVVMLFCEIYEEFHCSLTLIFNPDYGTFAFLGAIPLSSALIHLDAKDTRLLVGRDMVCRTAFRSLIFNSAMANLLIAVPVMLTFRIAAIALDAPCSPTGIPA